MENERNHVDARVVNVWPGRYGAEACISCSDFHSLAVISDDVAVVQMRRTNIQITKPIYIGLSVLDLSKTLMYDFHYSKMKTWVGSKCKLMYMDMNSFIYEITGTDIYQVMREHREFFDTSAYPENNRFGITPANAKVVGLFKDECNSQILTHFIGLRSKMYSLMIENKPPVMKAKGVKSSAVKTITFENYKECLFKEKF